MKIAKLYEEEFFQIDHRMYNTEKAICYALDQLGFKLGDDFEFFAEIDNIPFTKTQKHKVDVMLTSRNDGSKLYVEIKGMMTYLEVNKLKYLLTKTGKYFYVLQLTELDRIKPYKGKTAQSASKKYKSDFEKQVMELASFINGSKTGEELTNLSMKRLEDYLKCRNKDLEKWSDPQ